MNIGEVIQNAMFNNIKKIIELEKERQELINLFRDNYPIASSKNNTKYTTHVYKIKDKFYNIFYIDFDRCYVCLEEIGKYLEDVDVTFSQFDSIYKESLKLKENMEEI